VEQQQVVTPTRLGRPELVVRGEERVRHRQAGAPGVAFTTTSVPSACVASHTAWWVPPANRSTVTASLRNGVIRAP
jgi:hypothetical protein